MNKILQESDGMKANGKCGELVRSGSKRLRQRRLQKVVTLNSLTTMDRGPEKEARHAERAKLKIKS